MIVLHGLKACETCRKARRTLGSAGLEVRIRDLREEPVTRDELAAWTDAFGAEMLNRRSATWRGLSLEARGMDPIALMAAHPALIKRPIVEMPTGEVRLGWTEETRIDLGL
jgi:arsenate reductase